MFTEEILKNSKEFKEWITGRVALIHNIYHGSKEPATYIVLHQDMGKWTITRFFKSGGKIQVSNDHVNISTIETFGVLLSNCFDRKKEEQFIMKKNYLLTDFNTDRWKGINLQNVEDEIKKLNKIDILWGEIWNLPTLSGCLKPEKTDLSVVSLSNVSHSIGNLILKGGKVYGNVGFLNNENGRQAENLVNDLGCEFGVRCSISYQNSEIIIHEIFTWDIIHS